MCRSTMPRRAHASAWESGSRIGTNPLARGSQAVDAELHHVSRDQIAWGLLAESHPGRGARGDDVAGQKRHEAADVADERWYVPDELASRRTLLHLTVDLE